MSFPVVLIDWNDCRTTHDGLLVGEKVIAVDLDSSCGWCFATVVKSNGCWAELMMDGAMNYWPGAFDPPSAG